MISFKSEARTWVGVQFSADGQQLRALGGPSLADLVQAWDATPLPVGSSKPKADRN